MLQWLCGALTEQKTNKTRWGEFEFILAVGKWKLHHPHQVSLLQQHLCSIWQNVKKKKMDTPSSTPSPMFSLQLHGSVLLLRLMQKCQVLFTMNETCDAATAKPAFTCDSLWPTLHVVVYLKFLSVHAILIFSPVLEDQSISGFFSWLKGWTSHKNHWL